MPTYSQVFIGTLMAVMAQGNPGPFPGVFQRKTRSRSETGMSNGYVHIKEAPPMSISARQHGKAVLECSASGQPAPSIEWLKDGVPIVQDWSELGESEEGYSMGETKSRISLDCVTQEDAGEYECVASTGSHQDSVTTRVQVVSFEDTGCRPKTIADVSQPPKIIQWLGTYLQIEGSEARLKCRSVGGPHKTTWTGPADQDVTNAPRHKVLHSGDLVISNLGWNDMGSYTCVTANGYGIDKATTFLYPMADPSLHQH